METEEQKWDRINERSQNQIFLGMALKEVCTKKDYRTCLIEQDAAVKFEDEVVQLYRFFKQIKKDLKDDKENI